MLTIGQLARVAGVTVKAVRHYHSRGLLPEPERDASGYRRYDAAAAVTLIRIRTLAEAGVPLARVADLLRAGTEEFAHAVEQIDADLAARIERLREHRSRVAQLTGSDGIALPADVVAYLERLREVGVSEAMVRIERDGWILLAAHAAGRVADWIRVKHAALAEPAYLQMYLRVDAALDWSPDDPRVEQLADDLIDLALAAAAEGKEWAATDPIDVDAGTAELMSGWVAAAPPSWVRIGERAAERGVRGWV